MKIKKIKIGSSYMSTIEDYFFGVTSKFDPIKFNVNDKVFKAEITIEPVSSIATKHKEVVIYIKVEDDKYETHEMKRSSNIYDFTEGIYFDNNSENTYKLYCGETKNVGVLRDKRDYLFERIKRDSDYARHILYDKSLSDNIERIDFLYVLLLNNFYQGDFLEKKEDKYFLINKLSYFGYDEEMDKPKKENTMDSIFEIMLYYMTNQLYLKKKCKVNVYRIKNWYHIYIEEYINSLSI